MSQSTETEPRNRVSIETGFINLSGDIDSRLVDGKTLGLAYQYALNRYLSLETGYFYGIGTASEVERVSTNIYNNAPWIPNYQFKFHQFDLSLGVHKTLFEKIELRGQYGIGLYTSSAASNYLDASNQPYQDTDQSLDSTYESGGYIKKGLFRVNDASFVLSHNLSLRVGYKVSQRLSIGLSNHYIISDNDYIDGIKQRSYEDQISDSDIVSRLTLSVSYSW